MYCQPLVTVLYDGINKIFRALKENNFLIIVAVIHPSFQTAQINFAISLLKDAMCVINSDNVDQFVGAVASNSI